MYSDNKRELIEAIDRVLERRRIPHSNWANVNGMEALYALKQELENPEKKEEKEQVIRYKAPGRSDEVKTVSV